MRVCGGDGDLAAGADGWCTGAELEVSSPSKSGGRWILGAKQGISVQREAATEALDASTGISTPFLQGLNPNLINYWVPFTQLCRKGREIDSGADIDIYHVCYPLEEKYYLTGRCVNSVGDDTLQTWLWD